MVKRKPKRFTIIAIAVIAVFVGVVIAIHGKDKPSNGIKHTISSESPSTISLLATGDFIAHDSVNQAARQPDGTYNYLPMMSEFVPIFSKAGIRFCNDPILNGGSEFGISGYPKFNSPTSFVTDMGKLGCNLVNTASNHSFDRGQDAISASVAAWSKVPNMLAVAGQNNSPEAKQTIHYFTVKGVKFAFLAYTTYVNADASAQNSYGVNIFSKSFASEQIAEARQNGAKFIIVSMRWGTEYSSDVNPAQINNAQWLADQGVNLILGHGPHVLQTMQTLTGQNGNKTVVWYSLGNFINTQIPPETLFNGLALMEINPKTLEISNFRYLPIYMHYEWTAEQAKRQDATDLLARHNLKLYLLENTTQSMIDNQQLKTTVEAQKSRIDTTLNKYNKVQLITSKEL